MKLAVLCYLTQDGKTLMLHRVKKANDYHEGKWNGLGGKFEPGETPEECAKREVLEESGLLMIEPKLRGLITFPMFDEKDDWYVFIYTCDKFTGQIIECSEGDLEWIPNDKILDLNLWEGDEIFLNWLNQNKFFSAKFAYEAGKYLSHEVVFY